MKNSLIQSKAGFQNSLNQACVMSKEAGIISKITYGYLTIYFRNSKNSIKFHRKISLIVKFGRG